MPRCKTKAVVFDLDDTIGHFEQLSIFISGLEQLIVGFKQQKKYFTKILDMFPEIFRPGIIDSLKLLKKRKKRDKCLKVIIYTNNNGPRGWTIAIKNYLENKINSKIFDRIITKYDQHSIINCRSTHNKTHKDLVRCTNLPKQTHILFLDDQYHELMNHKNIQYLKLVPYNYHFSSDIMIKRFLHSSIGKALPKEKHSYFKVFMKKVLRSEKDYIIQKNRISKKDRKEKKRLLNEIKKFTTIHKQTRKYHNKNDRQTKRKYF
jgi:hypothetical protein